MKTIGDRIKQVRNEASLTLASFAQKIGVKSPSVSRWETGINNPSPRTIKIICSEFGINSDWLTNGEGEMRSITKETAVSNDLDQKFFEMYLSLPPEQKECMQGFMRLITSNKMQQE